MPWLISYPLISKRVDLNSDHWETLNRWQQRELVYHELGHCLFGLDHVTGEAIMNPFAKKRYHVKADGSNWRRLVAQMIRRVSSRP